MHGYAYLQALARRIRYDILASTTRAGSGHASSSLSTVELTTALLFGGFFRADPHRPDHPNNDRLIFSKGHAAPLLYSLYAAAGVVSEDELLSLRTFGSRLEGHPTPAFPYAEAATGSLGQGLSVGFGMALNGKYLDRLPYRTFVLLGNSEMAEGSQWEALQLAAHYELGNLVGCPTRPYRCTASPWTSSRAAESRRSSWIMQAFPQERSRKRFIPYFPTEQTTYEDLHRQRGPGTDHGRQILWHPGRGDHQSLPDQEGGG
ncbi:MAG: 1-deoxy-D-xylulose-5-phosphate synthase N-terminal domain-containing protein, partial [Desulfohalobiaceae bacterium]